MDASPEPQQAEAPDAAESGEGAQPTRIQVVVRVRPVLAHEELRDVAVTCAPDGSRVQVLLPERKCCKPQTPGAAPKNGAAAASLPRARPDARVYEFDACLPGATTQAQLFDACGVEELVEAALDGYSSMIFAFGQTGSGKTHTIVGPRLGQLQAAAGAGVEAPQTPPPPQVEAVEAAAAARWEDGPLVAEEDGLLPRCAQALFSLASQRASEADFSLAVSCLEVYNEAVSDLLAADRQRPCQVRQDPRSEAFYVPGLTRIPVTSPKDAVAALAAALAYRHTRAHRLNVSSSRSHCLVAFDVHSEDRSGQGFGGRGVRRAGRLVLVDLAGSERLKDTGSDGGSGGGGGGGGGGGAVAGDRLAALRETGAINRSLFTLGQVLAALSLRNGRHGAPAGPGHSHVPYRDAKLTQLLWDGLRGSGRALMVACLAPLKQQAEESINTLHFAGMALRVRGESVITVDPQDAAVMELRSTVQALRADVRTLAGALHAVSQPGADVPSVLRALPPTLLQDAIRVGAGGASAPAGIGGNGGGGGGGGGSASGWGAPGGLLSAAALSGAPPLATAPGSLDGGASTRSPASPLPWGIRGSASSPGSPASGPARSNAGGKPAGASPAPPRPAWSLSGAAAALLPGGRGTGGAPSPPRRQPAWVGSSSFSPMFRGQPSPPRFPLSPPAAARFGGPAARAQMGLGAWPLLRSSGGIGGRGGSNAGSLDASGRPSWLAAAGSSAGGRAEGLSPFDKPLSSFPQLAALEAAFQTGDTQLLADASSHSLAGAAPADTGPSHVAAAVPGVLPPVVPTRVPQAVAASVLLPASVEAPRSLLPVRTSVSDASGAAAVGQSAVQLATAAAAAGVRPQQLQQQPRSPSPPRARHQQHTHRGHQPQPEPEPDALAWARRNPWFGVDEGMTAVAYSAHDAHVAAGGQPAGDAYFAAIEAAVAGALPEQWQAWRSGGGGGGGAETGARQQAEGQRRVSPRLRVSLKDATPAAAAGLNGGGGSDGPGSLAGAARQPLKAPGLTTAHPRLAAMSAYQHHRLPVTTWEASLARFTAKQQQPQQQPQQPQQPPHPQQPQQPQQPEPPHPLPAEASSVAGHAGSKAVLPRAHAGLPGLVRPLPDTRARRKDGSRRSAAGGLGTWQQLGAYGGSGGGGGGSGGGGGGASDYAAARQQVLDELRQAREAAERQRRAILLQFGRAVGRQWL
ncbi:kinesin [Raphidocelis subcapitata]|uniref:Kinesin n=1 Tax=Raphidocelis subcapitata TaxID=307507 RepID=A0A2V0PPF6_9CHLO|nr:kinesin [Raphidocelis subcapitata]|eukprot:GBF99065.1 kinesin [Raphidocelis subcapitata]